MDAHTAGVDGEKSLNFNLGSSRLCSFHGALVSGESNAFRGKGASKSLFMQYTEKHVSGNSYGLD